MQRDYLFLATAIRKNAANLADIEASKTVSLPDPELFIIVNGVPTKKKVIWRTLVDIKQLNAALGKLKDINWLYQLVDDDNVDELAKKVVEVCNSVTSTMFEKATPDDIHGLQSFTIRSLDSKVNTDSDIEQYNCSLSEKRP